jgi:hypothetical protein
VIGLRFMGGSYQLLLTVRPLHTGGCGLLGGKVGNGGVSYHPGVDQRPISTLLFQRVLLPSAAGLPQPSGFLLPSGQIMLDAVGKGTVVGVP